MGGKVKGVITVRFAAEDGKPGESITIVLTSVKYATSGSGTEKPSAEAWSSSVPSVPDGMWLWTWTRVLYSDGTETNSYSVARSGIDGNGIQSSAVTYSLQETNVQPESITEWGSFPAELTDGWWLYTRTEMVYSDGARSVSYSVSQVGTGSYYAGTQEYYAVSASKDTPPSGAPSAGTYVNGQSLSIGSGWSASRPSATASRPYIWNFEVSADSRGNRYVTEAICIGNFSLGIASIVETYAISAQGTRPSGRDYPSDIAEADWQDESHAVPPTDSKPYMWNKTATTYNDASKAYSYHVCAVKGADGRGAVYIDLDNENGALLYDGDGNVGSPCYSTMRLYANGSDVTSKVTFSIEYQTTNVTASIDKAILTVSGCSGGTGYVIVKCMYDGVSYYARFSVRRVDGTYKYDLLVSPSAVSHNSTTGVVSPSSVKVEVYRTSHNGDRELLASLPEDYTLKRFSDDSASGTAMSYASSASFSVSSGVGRYRIELRDYLGTLLDAETVPVLHVKNGDKGTDGTDGFSLFCQCAALSVSTDSGGKPLAAASKSIGIYWLKGAEQVSDSAISKVVINGVTYTASGTYGGISFSFSAKSLALGFSTSRSISDTIFEVYVKSAAYSIERSCKISVSAARQGSQGVQGIAGAMMRNRGTFTEAQLRVTSEEIYNNASYIDYIRYKGDDGTYAYYRLKDSVQRWTKGGYYTKSAPSTLVSASAPYLPSASSSVWMKFDYRDSSAFSFLISSRADIDTATMCQAFIGDNGAVDNGDGTISVSGANGWAVANGQIRHTKTGLTLTADGHLYDPDGLHLKVGGSESSALPSTSLVAAGANMAADPILQDRDHFGTANKVKDDVYAIPVKGNFITKNGTSSAYARWTGQTGADTSTLNYMSPWRGDGGHVITLNIASGTCASDREVYLPQQPKNRVKVVTSTSVQSNVYTFSLWFKATDIDKVMDYIAGFTVFKEEKVSSGNTACYMHKRGTMAVSNKSSVVTVAEGIVDGSDGWMQYYFSFKVMRYGAVASGSGTYGAEAWVDWYPVIHPSATNFYVAYAGAKIEGGSAPTAMAYTTQAMRKKLLDTGIDIDSKSIVCTADSFECQNLKGERTAWLDDTGVFIAAGVFNNLINVIDWKNNVGRDKLIVVYMNSGTPVAYLGNDNLTYSMSGELVDRADLIYDDVMVSLDVLRLGNVVRIKSLPSDAVGSTGDNRYIRLPYFVHADIQCRTYTRFNASSDSAPRLVKADEMRMLGGRRMTIVSTADSRWTLLADHRVSFYDGYMPVDDQMANGYYECRFPVGNYELGSGCSLAGSVAITIECRQAYFYDYDNMSKPLQSRSGFGYVWVGMQSESLSSYGVTGLDTWN